MWDEFVVVEFFCMWGSEIAKYNNAIWFLLVYPNIWTGQRNGRKIVHTCKYKNVLGLSQYMSNGKLLPSRGSIF